MKGQKEIKADSFDNLIKILKEKINNNPEALNLWISLFSSLIKNNQVQQIVNEFEYLVNLLPTWTQFHSNILEYFIKEGYIELLISTFKKGLEFKSKNPVLYYGLGLIYQTVDLYDKALKVYEKALSLKPNFTVVYHNMGITYACLNQIDKAIECSLEGIKNPLVVESYYLLATLFQKKGVITPKYFERFIELAPPYLSQYKRIAEETLKNLKKTYKVPM